jgi:2'-5' RNA ligase
MKAERLFIALTLPEPVRQVLAATAEPIPGVAWTRLEQIHVTLRFLGDVATEDETQLIDRLAAVRVEPFVLPVEGVGAFPPHAPPRVIWAGVGRGHPRLFQLRQRLDDTVVGLGLPVEVRTFHPHATLARCAERSAAGVAGWLRRHAGLVAPPFRVEAFDLYASELRPEGAVHTLVQRFPLGD